MSLIELPSLSRASLNGTIGARTQMGTSEEELEVDPPLAVREEEVFLFIVRGKEK